jgi:hypothetical protein
MKRTWMGLALASAAWFALSAGAAPAPTAPSEGPISDALALRGVLPKTPPPTASVAVVPEMGVIELGRVVLVPVAKEVTETVVGPDGKQEQVKRVVTETVPQTTTVRVKAESVKFFTVTRDGKLDALDAAKAAAMLKQRMPVLTGDSPDVDPRALELVKPGTLYLVPPPPEPELPHVPPLPPGADKRP